MSLGRPPAQSDHLGRGLPGVVQLSLVQSDHLGRGLPGVVQLSLVNRRLVVSVVVGFVPPLERRPRRPPVRASRVCASRACRDRLRGCAQVNRLIVTRE